MLARGPGLKVEGVGGLRVWVWARVRARVMGGERGDERWRCASLASIGKHLSWCSSRRCLPEVSG